MRLDGHERFADRARYLGIQLNRDSNITTGKIYQHVIVRSHYGGSSLADQG